MLIFDLIKRFLLINPKCEFFVSGGGRSSGVDTGDIPAALRFRGAQRLNYAFPVGGSTTTGTFSKWIHPTDISTANELWSCANYEFVELGTDGRLCIPYLGNLGYMYSTAVFRDLPAPIHVVVTFDTANATEADRLRLYVNGVRQTLTGVSMTQNATFQRWNKNGYTGAIGNFNYDNSRHFKGYMSRFCWVDGVALGPEAFGYFNAQINEWVTKTQAQVKAVVDAGGVTSVMLDFDNATSLAALGYDKSSKGNHWTPNGFSLTAGTTYDHMLAVPGNSFCTSNAINGQAGFVPSEGNLKVTVSGTATGQRLSTIAVTTGKWVWEYTYLAAPNGDGEYGVSLADSPVLTNQLGTDAKGWGYSPFNGSIYHGSSSPIATVAAASLNDVIRFELDCDAQTMAVFKQNSLIYTFTGVTGGVLTPAIGGSSSVAFSTALNFGQAPLHASATYHSGAGGYFKDAPSTGFKALCQRNLPDVTASLLDPTDHHIDIAITKSGDTNFTLPWNADTYDTFFEIKRRDSTGDWYQIDGLRGYDKILKSNSTAAETTDANVLGVSGTTCTLKSTLADGTYIISATKAGLTASRQTNTDGSITSTVSRNVGSGFVIVTAKGNGTAGATIGHGSGKVPVFIIPKNRSAAGNWHCYHSALGGTKGVLLNATNAASTDAGFWNNTSPTSSVITLGTYNVFDNEDYVFYCYADSAIQKSFSYTGNGSADGPNPFLGFKCGRTLAKNISIAEGWEVIDSARDQNNVAKALLEMSNTNAENTALDQLDLNALSIKVRNTRNAYNASTQTYIGHAWAATNGKYSLGR